MTMTHGSPPTLALGGNTHVARWTPATPSAPEAEHGLMGRLDGARDEDGLPRATAEARAALRETASAAVEAAARAHSLAALLDETLAALEDGQPVPALTSVPLPAAQLRTDMLSPREWDVLALVAEGRTNKAIAEALYVSPSTVKSHVTSLLHKLHADSRAQLAAIAVRQGMPPHAR